MNIGFIEDTHLHGGTQIWVTEAMTAFLNRGENVTLLAPEGSWIVRECSTLGADIFTYDWDDVVQEGKDQVIKWTEALAQCDLAICTVHPPREGFHCSMFAAKCISLADLQTHLIPKTGTIVPEYKREYYLPDRDINSSVIAIADFTRQYLINTYGIPEELITLIYQGVDTERFTSSDEGRKEASQRYSLPDGSAPILGSVGSFEPRKGHPVLFEAVARLAAGPLPDIQLLLVGDGPDEGTLRNLAKELGLENHISVHPFTSEPYYVFERIDLTVLPSLYKEGLPNVLQESMAMGVPVVSSNIGGVPEVVIDGHTGFMVEPGDSRQLSETIQRIWKDQEAYRNMRWQARKLIEKQFDKNRQFDSFLKHFQSIIN